jgi:hypothetical protein
MIHELNDLLLAILKMGIGDKDKPITVEDIGAELILCFKRLKMKSTKNEENEELEEHGLFNVQFKGKCRNCRRIGQKSFQRKNPSSHNVGNNGDTNVGNYCSLCRANRER